MEMKKIVLRVFFVLEIGLFLFFYFFGAQGLPKLHNYKKQNIQILAEITTLQAEVAALRLALAEWDDHPFYKEKFAREELQMGKENEVIYHYPEKL